MMNDNQVIHALTNYLIFLIIIDLLSRLLIYVYSRRRRQSIDKKNNFHFGINNIYQVLVGIGFVVTLFGIFGVDFRSLLTSLSIVAAAIAIISKEFINDFLVGLYFSFSEDFEIHDYVKFGEQKGKITEISVLKIKLLNDDDDLVVIPNGKVYNGEIINYTKRDIRMMSIDFQIDIKAVGNIEFLEKDLIQTLEGFSEFIEDKSYNLKIVEMRKDYLDIKFQYRLRKLDRELQRNIRRKTVREVFNYISSRIPLTSTNYGNE
jgi:small-conductance mechanosensitive channel